MEPKKGKKVAAATKKEIIRNIRRKGFCGTTEPKVFKTDDLFKVTIWEMANLPVFSKEKTGDSAGKKLSSFGGNKRHNRDRASSFDGYSQLSLMFGAIAGNSAGHNLASLGYEIIENSRILIINL